MLEINNLMMRVAFCTVLFCIVIAVGNAEISMVNIVNATDTNPEQLTCTESNEARDYEWLYQPVGSEEKIRKTVYQNVYEITSAGVVGIYYCRINGSDFKTFKAINFIQPEIERTERSITYIEGYNDQTIECVSYSYPNPNFTWTITYPDGSNKTLSTDDIYKITSTGGKSIVTISVVSEVVRGWYNCTASNEAGHGMTSVQVRVHARLAPLWPFLGIVAEVAIVALIIFIVRKRSKTPEEELRAPFQSSGLSETSQEADSSGVRLRNSKRS